MKLVFRCPRCQNSVVTRTAALPDSVRCAHCDWSRGVPENSAARTQPVQCLVCGCGDLWRQKDFPQRLGLFLVILGTVFSTIAWYHHRPLTAIGILLGLALADLVLFAFMKDMLVCYRCRAQHRDAQTDDQHPRFSLELAERYRQEQLRVRPKSW